MIADATFGSRSTHASASCAIVMPSPSATGRSSCTRSSSVVVVARSMKLAHRLRAHAAVAGRRLPGWYLPVSTPCASGDQTICEMPLRRAERDDVALRPAPEHRVLRLARHELLDARELERLLDLLGRPFAEAEIARLARRTTSVSASIVSSSGVSQS